MSTPAAVVMPTLRASTKKRALGSVGLGTPTEAPEDDCDAPPRPDWNPSWAACQKRVRFVGRNLNRRLRSGEESRREAYPRGLPMPLMHSSVRSKLDPTSNPKVER